MSFYAYKGFDKDLKCRGFQYEIGKTYEMEEEPILCKRGFHFCEKLTDVAPYYPFVVYVYNEYFKIEDAYKSSNRYCVVEAIGDICEDKGLQFDTKHATNKIRIVRELDQKEISDILHKENPFSYIAIYGGLMDIKGGQDDSISN